MNCNQCFWLQIVAWCCSLSLQQVSSATFSECNFNTFKNFQSAVRFSINSKNIIKIREQKIDEKGVLFVQNSDNSNEKVYYLNGNQHIVRYDEQNKFERFDLIDGEVLVAQIGHYAFKHTKLHGLTVGPSAILEQLKSLSLVPQNVTNIFYRGINVTSCVYQLSYFATLKKVIIGLYVSENGNPIAYKVIGQEMNSKMVVWNADFYSYQEIIQSNQSISSNTNQMQLSFCLSAIDCQFSYPFAYTPQIQTRTEFVLGFIDRNAREIDFNVKLDLELKMAAIESSNARPLWLIDENRKLAFFRNNLGQCEHVDTGRLSDKGTLFVELIQDLINLNQYRLNVKSDFRYVGQRVLQGLITEVFSRQYWDAKRNETIVITYYLLNEKIEDRVMRVIPLRATKRRFFKIVNTTYSDVPMFQFNFYNHRQLPLGPNYDNSFTMDRCMTESLQQFHFVLHDAKVNKKDIEFFKTNQIRFMHSLKTLLSQAFEKSYLSYFNFHVEDILIGFQSISVRMKTTYLTNAAELFYSFDPTTFDVSKMKTKKFFASQKECALVALQESSIFGYVFCGTNDCEMVTSAESFSSKKDYRRLQYHPFRTCRGYRKPSFVGNVLTFPPIGRVKEQLRNRTAARKLYVGGHSIQEQTYIFTQFHETVADEQPAGLDYKFLYVTSAIDGHETLHRQPLNATNVLQCRDLCLNYSSGETICRSFSLCRTESFGRFQCWLRDTPEKEVPSLLRTFGGDNERAAELMRESSREQGCRHFQMQYKNRYHILKNKSGSKSDLISQPEQVMTSEQCVQKCEQTRGAMHGRCRQVQLCRLDSESVKASLNNAESDDEPLYRCSLYNQTMYEHSAIERPQSIECDLLMPEEMRHFEKQPTTMIPHFTRIEQISMQECAHRCRMQSKCNQFNWCKENNFGQNVCELESASIDSENSTSHIRTQCTSMKRIERLTQSIDVKSKSIDLKRNQLESDLPSPSSETTKQVNYAKLVFCFAFLIGMLASAVRTELRRPDQKDEHIRSKTKEENAFNRLVVGVRLTDIQLKSSTAKLIWQTKSNISRSDSISSLS